MSLSLGHFPTTWKRANVTPIFKKDDPSLPSSYRPISLLCILSKVFERCVSYHCQHHLSQFISDFQHDFRKGRSTESQLLEVYHDILDSLAPGKEVDVYIWILRRPSIKFLTTCWLKNWNDMVFPDPCYSGWRVIWLTDTNVLFLMGTIPIGFQQVRGAAFIPCFYQWLTQLYPFGFKLGTICGWLRLPIFAISSPTRSQWPSPMEFGF
jgi:hypothetical protein